MNQALPKAVFASADAAMQAGLWARQQGRTTEEREAAEAAVRLDPARGDAWIGLASVASRQQDHERAEQAQLKALETTDDPLMRERLTVDRAWNLACQCRYAEALVLARAERPMLSTDAISRNILGATLMTTGKGAEALPHLEFAVKAMPERPDIWFNLAVIYNSLGRVPEAREALEKIIAMAPGYLPAHEFMGELMSAKASPEYVDRLRDIRARMPSGPDTPYVDFALFRQLDGLDRRDEAWRVLVRANEAKRKIKAWSPADDEALADAMRNLQRSLRPAAPAAAAAPRPIFITSLPRTGSTLTERIFAAHPDVQALGELEAFGRAMKRVAGLPAAPYVDARLGEAAAGMDWNAVGEDYRAEVRGLAEGAPVTTDKMPLNWWYAPALAAALPDSVVVHVSRQPMDALFGAYKISFTKAFSWAYDFADLAGHYGVYRRLMDDWRKALGDRLVDVDYETLVREPEQQTRRLLEACGLAFDEACLKPHLSAGSVSTPSATQVRAPMTSGKIGAWRRYAAELEPLRALLQRDGWVDANGDGVA